MKCYFMQENSLWRILGFRWEGLLPALVFPLILTAILFLGPLSMEGFTGLWSIYLGKSSINLIYKLPIFKMFKKKFSLFL